VLHCVNWPKGFFVEGLVPEGVAGADGKSKLRTLLAQQRIPRGTETKYINTLDFFDQMYEEQNLKELEHPAQPSQAAPGSEPA